MIVYVSVIRVTCVMNVLLKRVVNIHWEYPFFYLGHSQRARVEEFILQLLLYLHLLLNLHSFEVLYVSLRAYIHTEPHKHGLCIYILTSIKVVNNKKKEEKRGIYGRKYRECQGKNVSY